jgi:hypothetical protein
LPQAGAPTCDCTPGEIADGLHGGGIQLLQHGDQQVNGLIEIAHDTH